MLTKALLVRRRKLLAHYRFLQADDSSVENAEEAKATIASLLFSGKIIWTVFALMTVLLIGTLTLEIVIMVNNVNTDESFDVWLDDKIGAAAVKSGAMRLTERYDNCKQEVLMKQSTSFR